MTAVTTELEPNNHQPPQQSADTPGSNGQDPKPEAAASATAENPEPPTVGVSNNDAAVTARSKLDAVRRVVARAKSGDTTALPALRQALTEHPEYFENAGNLSLMSQRVWFQLLTKNDLFLRETIEQELAKLRQDLEGDDPTPIEKLVVGQVVSCFFQLRITEMNFASSLDQPESIRKELMKRQEFAQRRFTDSIAQLEKIQRRRLVAVKSAPSETVKAREATDDPLRVAGRCYQGQGNGSTVMTRGTDDSDNTENVSGFPRISHELEVAALLNGVGVDD